MTKWEFSIDESVLTSGSGSGGSKHTITVQLDTDSNIVIFDETNGTDSVNTYTLVTPTDPTATNAISTVLTVYFTTTALISSSTGYYGIKIFPPPQPGYPNYADHGSDPPGWSFISYTSSDNVGNSGYEEFSITFNGTDTTNTGFYNTAGTLPIGWYDAGATEHDATIWTSVFEVIGISSFPPYSGPPFSNTCFVAGTPVNTDQGLIPIDQLDHHINTISGQSIVAISKITSTDSHLIFLKAHCLGPNQPSQDTTVSKLHKIMYNGTMFPAQNLPNVEQIPYDGQPLYNVLLENYSTMTVNNLTVETLHPRSNVAVLYKYITTNNIDAAEKNKLIGLLNTKLDKTNNLRKAFFSNIVTVIMLNLLTEPKEEHVKVTPYSLIQAFLPNAALISKSNPLFW